MKLRYELKIKAGLPVFVGIMTDSSGEHAGFRKAVITQEFANRLIYHMLGRISSYELEDKRYTVSDLVLKEFSLNVDYDIQSELARLAGLELGEVDIPVFSCDILHESLLKLVKHDPEEEFTAVFEVEVEEGMSMYLFKYFHKKGEADPSFKAIPFVLTPEIQELVFKEFMESHGTSIFFEEGDWSFSQMVMELHVNKLSQKLRELIGKLIGVPETKKSVWCISTDPEECLFEPAS